MDDWDWNWESYEHDTIKIEFRTDLSGGVVITFMDLSCLDFTKDGIRADILGETLVEFMRGRGYVLASDREES